MTKHRVAITGIGMSQVGRRLMVDPITLTVDAAKQAIADAGLEPSDIDGLSTYPGPGIGVGMCFASWNTLSDRATTS